MGKSIPTTTPRFCIECRKKIKQGGTRNLCAICAKKEEKKMKVYEDYLDTTLDKYQNNPDFQRAMAEPMTPCPCGCGEYE